MTTSWLESPYTLIYLAPEPADERVGAVLREAFGETGWSIMSPDDPRFLEGVDRVAREPSLTVIDRARGIFQMQTVEEARHARFVLLDPEGNTPRGGTLPHASG